MLELTGEQMMAQDGYSTFGQHKTLSLARARHRMLQSVCPAAAARNVPIAGARPQAPVREGQDRSGKATLARGEMPSLRQVQRSSENGSLGGAHH